jgi:enoyl-CoA hydratase/carnithine racemase
LHTIFIYTSRKQSSDNPLTFKKTASGRRDHREQDTMTETTDNDAVLFELSASKHVGTITLNRPDNRNSMTAELLDAFALAVKKAKGETEMRALIITGKGKCFSAGADLNAKLQRDDHSLPHERSFAMYQPFLSLLDLSCPIIGALNGHAVGGGFGL